MSGSSGGGGSVLDTGNSMYECPSSSEPQEPKEVGGESIEGKERDSIGACRGK